MFLETWSITNSASSSTSTLIVIVSAEPDLLVKTSLMLHVLERSTVRAVPPDEATENNAESDRTTQNPILYIPKDKSTRATITQPLALGALPLTDR